MLAISIRQPWAGLIMLELKDIETRTWPVPKRLIGQEICIHASATMDKKALQALRGEIPEFNDMSLDPFDHLSIFNGGYILGTVKVLGGKEYKTQEEFYQDEERHRCIKKHFEAVPFGHIYKVTKKLDEPIKCRGQLKYFRPDLSAVQKGLFGNK